MILAFALLGLFVGSFANVCIDRLPRGQSIIRPPSHCPECGRRLGILDLVPVFSYLWLRGRCRYCRARIPVRLPIVEAATGALFALLYWKFGLSAELGIYIVYASLLAIICVIDLENQLVLDKVLYPGIAVTLLLSFVRPGHGMVSALEGGALGLVFLALPYIVYRRGMGLGDVKLGALVGLMSQYPLVIITLLLSVIAGGVVASFLLVFKLKKRNDPVPFAPFLTTATVGTLVWGETLFRWYF